jgi:hypothetical protein
MDGEQGSEADQMVLKERLMKQIYLDLRSVSYDWGDDFRFTLTEDSFYDGRLCVSVEVKHHYYPDMCHCFNAALTDGEKTQIELGEDSWYDLDYKHFFAFMFFESENKRITESERAKRR